MLLLARVVLVLALGLVAAPVQGQDAEECPNSERLRLSEKELREQLLNHQIWVENGGRENPAVPGRAVLCNVNLSRANLAGAELVGANLKGATLSYANLEGANLAWVNLESANLSFAQLQNARLWQAQLQGAYVYRAQLQNADLREANLEGADLIGAQLQGAYLWKAQLQEAGLSGAQLQGANLISAQLQGADLNGAQLQNALLHDTDLSGADLRSADLSFAVLQSTDLEGAKLSYAALPWAWYQPATSPAPGYLGALSGLTTVRFHPGESSGLVQLRARLAEVGLQDLERDATYAIERNKTHHLLFRQVQADEQGGVKEVLRWREPLKLVEGSFRVVAFEWPVAYGLHPGRALLVLVASIGVFALVYLIPLARSGSGDIYRVWPEKRLEARSSTAEPVGQAEPEPLHPRGWWGLKRILRALQFSILSAFHLGWREFNVGNWISRLQFREYSLQATGWVRAVAGVQSLLSVYLLAMWALTYFGRPFG